MWMWRPEVNLTVIPQCLVFEMRSFFTWPGTFWWEADEFRDPPVSFPALGLQAHDTSHRSWALNSGSHDCMAHTESTAPSPQPLSMFQSDVIPGKVSPAFNPSTQLGLEYLTSSRLDFVAHEFKASLDYKVRSLSKQMKNRNKTEAVRAFL